MGFLTGLLGLVGMAAWESHTTSREYIYKKHPELAERDRQQAENFDKINADYRKRRAEIGYPVADDFELYHNCKK